MRSTLSRFRLRFCLLALATGFAVTPVPMAEAQQYLYIFKQPALQNGPIEVQAKSDVEISLEMIALTDIYQYPELFSFDIHDFPEWRNFGDPFTKLYPEGPLGRQWQSPFVTLNGSEQMLIGWVKVRNGTAHILRMGDARIYLVWEGHDPIAALSSPDSLLKRVTYFEKTTDHYLSQLPRPLISFRRKIPDGFFRWIVLSHRDSYRLINDLSREILPGSTLEGMIAFPAIAAMSGQSKISFFDVVTRTDAIGNPVEKSQFDFLLTPRLVGMWYDRENMWKFQMGPFTATGSQSVQDARPGFGGFWRGRWESPDGQGDFSALLETSADSVKGVWCVSDGKNSTVLPFYKGTVKDARLNGEISMDNIVLSRAEITMSTDGQSWVGRHSQEVGEKTWDMSQGRSQATRHAVSGPGECGPRGFVNIQTP